jgi:hypothetical protein
MNPEDLERELTRLTAGIDAPPSAWSSIARRARVRRQRRLALVAGTLVGLAVTAGGLALRGDPDGPDLAAHPVPSATASQTTVPPLDIAVVTGPSGPRPTELVAVVAGAGNLYDLRGTAPRLVRRLSGSAPVTDIVFTPAREGVAYVERHGCRSSVWTARLDGSERHPVLDRAGWVTHPRLSPDGRYVAYSLNATCRPSSGDDYREQAAVADLTAGREIWRSRATASQIEALSWSEGTDAEPLLTGSLYYCCDASGEGIRFHPFGVYRRVEQRIPATVDRCDVQAIVVQGEHTLQVNGCDDGLRLGPVGQLRGAASLTGDLLPVQVALSANGAHALVLVGDGQRTRLVDVPLDGSPTDVLLTGVSAADW